MEEYLFLKNKENEITPEKNRLNIEYPNLSTIDKKEINMKSFNMTTQLYILVSEIPENFYQSVIRELSQFGNIKNIYYDYEKFSDWMIIEYENPNSAEMAAEQFDPNFLPNFRNYNKIKVSLLTEEKKNLIIENAVNTVHDVDHMPYLDSSQFLNQGYRQILPSKKATTEYYNKNVYIIEPVARSFLKKFLDVFFNF
jgi:hypothetical protein